MADFKHQRVDSLIAATNMQRIGMEEFLKTDRHPAPPFTLTQPREIMFEGLAVVRELERLCSALQRKYRRARFGVTTETCSAHWLDRSPQSPTRCYHEMWVYFEDQEYALFKVGYKDYGITVTDEKYGIYARGILNGKFKPDNERRYMKFSTSYDKIMDVARGQMRPYVVTDLAKLSYDSIYNSTYQHANNLKNSAGDFWINLRNHSHLGKELLNLLDSGYTFLSDDLKQRVIDYKQSLAVKASMPTTYHAYFVYVTEDPVLRTTMCNVLLYTDVDKFNSRKKAPVETNTLPLDDLPYDIAGKLAALNMLNVDDFLPDVGIKVSDRSFWVLRG